MYMLWLDGFDGKKQLTAAAASAKDHLHSTLELAKSFEDGVSFDTIALISHYPIVYHS